MLQYKIRHKKRERGQREGRSSWPWAGFHHLPLENSIQAGQPRGVSKTLCVLWGGGSKKENDQILWESTSYNSVPPKWGPESMCRVCEMWQRTHFSMRKSWIVGEEPEEWRRQIFFQFQNWRNGCIPETRGQSLQHWSLTARRTWLLTGWWAR